MNTIFGRSFGSMMESFVTVTLSLLFFTVLLQAIVGDRIAVLKPFVALLGKIFRLGLRGMLLLGRLVLYACEGVWLPEKKDKRAASRKEPSHEP